MTHDAQADKYEQVEDLTGRKRDLVEWLRSEEADNPGHDVSSGLLGLAADEIARLREIEQAYREELGLIPGE